MNVSHVNFLDHPIDTLEAYVARLSWIMSHFRDQNFAIIDGKILSDKCFILSLLGGGGHVSISFILLPEGAHVRQGFILSSGCALVTQCFVLSVTRGSLVRQCFLLSLNGTQCFVLSPDGAFVRQCFVLSSGGALIRQWRWVGRTKRRPT